MLTRALLDHVPPIFGVTAFNQLANYSGGTRSFKQTMLHLDTVAKKIADGILHNQIRKREPLPMVQQVNSSAAIDLLLEEIVTNDSMRRTHDYPDYSLWRATNPDRPPRECIGAG
jgi:hypothetical protein